MADSRPPDIRALVALAQRGDRPAFARLYELHARAVHAVLLARLPAPEVPDLVQEVFMTAITRLDDVREPARFPGWLMTIARNRATDWLRARAAAPVERGDPERAPEASAPATGSTRLEAAEVLAALRSLPEAYRETLLMRLAEGMSGPEIAAATGLDPGSVRVNLHRGMKLLRARLEGSSLADAGDDPEEAANE